MSAAVRITPEMRERLRALEVEGTLTPSRVVADAKDPASPLHDLFTWDVAVAAEKRWLDEARAIIRSVRIIQHPTETITLRSHAYVRDPAAPPTEQGYTAVENLKRDPVRAREAMRAEFARVEGALKRCRVIATALGLENELENLIAQVVRVRSLAA